MKLVIFDCDGVLVDTETITGRFLYQYLKSHGVNISEQEAICKFSGQNLSCAIKEMEILSNSQAPDDFIETFRKVTMEQFKTELKTIPGIKSALEQIPTKKCVASNGPMAKMELTLTATGLRQYFGDGVFSAYNVQKWKPDPGLFLHAAKTMGADPQSCIVVEDSIHGVKAALAAKMKILAFQSRKDDHNFSKSLQELAVPSFSKMSQLPQLIKTMLQS